MQKLAHSLQSIFTENNNQMGNIKHVQTITNVVNKKIMTKRAILLIYLILYSYLILIGQVFYENSPDSKFLYLKQIEGTDNTIIDEYMNIFNEETVFMKDSIIYMSSSIPNIRGEYIYMIERLCLTKAKNVEIFDVNTIQQRDYSKLFKKGMRVKFTNEGLCISFKSGSVEKLVFNYLDWDFNMIEMTLKKLEELP